MRKDGFTVAQNIILSVCGKKGVMPLRMFMKVRFALSLCFVALRVYHSDRSPVEI